MTAQLRSELLKATTTTTTAIVVGAAVAIALFGTVIEGVSPSDAKLAQELTQRTMFGANVAAVLLATIAGILAVTSEFRYGTIHPTLLFEPHRGRVLGAKFLVACVGGIVIALACTAASFAGGMAILAIRDVPFAVSGAHVLQLVLGTVVACALSGLIGVALGALIRNQFTVIVALLAYVVAVDAALFGAAPAVGRFLPGKASDALAGSAVDDLLSPGVGAGVFALWTLAFVVAAILWTARRDVELR